MPRSLRGQRRGGEVIVPVNNEDLREDMAIASKRELNMMSLAIQLIWSSPANRNVCIPTSYGSEQATCRSLRPLSPAEGSQVATRRQAGNDYSLCATVQWYEYIFFNALANPATMSGMITHRKLRHAGQGGSRSLARVPWFAPESSEEESKLSSSKSSPLMCPCIGNKSYTRERLLIDCMYRQHQPLPCFRALILCDNRYSQGVIVVVVGSGNMRCCSSETIDTGGLSPLQ